MQRITNEQGEKTMSQTLRNRLARAGAALSVLTISLALSTASAHAATPSDGTLDQSFGSAGKVTTQFGALSDEFHAVAVQPDGRIVAAGTAGKVGGASAAVARYRADGTLDTTFGTGGKVTTAIGTSNEVNAMALQPDGKIIVAGIAYLPPTYAASFAVTRYLNDGTLDPSFGSGGTATTSFAKTLASANAIALQPDGKIIVVGSNGDTGAKDLVIVRYLSTGQPDTTFGTGGKVTTDIAGRDDAANAVALLPDGKIVVAGYSDDPAPPNSLNGVLARYRGDGTLDPGFGTAGIVRDDRRGATIFRAMALQPDGKIIATGGEILLRYEAGGAVDGSFGYGFFPGRAEAIAQQRDGKAVLVGIGVGGSGLDIAVGRIRKDGTGDTTFAEVGATSTTFGPGDDVGWAVAIQPDNKIIAAGYAEVAGVRMAALVRYNVTYSGLATDAPKRILDTRGGTKPNSTSITKVTTGAPAGTSSVMVNLTATGAEAAGYIAADACSTLKPNAQSNLNFQPGIDIANTAVVALDDDGTFCLYTSQSAHLIADLQGSYQSSGLRLQTLTPTRILDTRNDSRPQANAIVRVSTGAPSGTRAVLANLTVTGASGAGYITADTCSSLQSGIPDRSNANFQQQADVANAAVVNLDPDGSFCIYTSQRADLVVDLQGTYQPIFGDTLTKVAPARLLDTRGTERPKAGSTTEVRTNAAGSRAVLVNLTVTGAEGSGYIVADNCSTLTTGPIQTSNTNFQAGVDIANTAVINLDADGSFCIYTNTAAHLLADIQGIY
jgi:uncharacterized delta-60 repeat protein